MHCICDDCRLAAGGEWFTWAFIPPDLITIEEPNALVWRISTPAFNIRRGFCGMCGCTIFYELPNRGPGREIWDVSAAVFEQDGLDNWLTYAPTLPPGSDPADEMYDGFLGPAWYQGVDRTVLSNFDEEAVKYNPDLVAALRRGRQECPRY
jgi:hypothetical protein